MFGVKAFGCIVGVLCVCGGLWSSAAVGGSLRLYLIAEFKRYTRAAMTDRVRVMGDGRRRLRRHWLVRA